MKNLLNCLFTGKVFLKSITMPPGTVTGTKTKVLAQVLRQREPTMRGYLLYVSNRLLECTSEGTPETGGTPCASRQYRKDIRNSSNAENGYHIGIIREHKIRIINHFRIKRSGAIGFGLIFWVTFCIKAKSNKQ